MILIGTDPSPGGKILAARGPVGPPGLDLSDITDLDGGTPSSTYGDIVIDGGGP